MSEFFDDSGLWWDDSKLYGSSRQAKQAKNIPALLRSVDWPVMKHDPAPLPHHLSGAVAFDFETEDPWLQTKGPSWAFPGVGKVIGLAIAYNDSTGTRADYYPVGHEVGNVSHDVGAWLRYHFKDPNLTWVGANTAYDLGWAFRDYTNGYPKGKVVDVQHMAALRDENRVSYSLDNIAKAELGEGKETSLIHNLMEKLDIRYMDVMSNLKYIPGPHVASYAGTDALRTLQVYRALLPVLQEQNLMKVFELECGLIPLTVEMRRRGIKIDVERAESERARLQSCAEELQNSIKSRCGVAVDPWSAELCAAALYTQGISVGTTKEGKPSVTAELLTKHSSNEVVAAISRLRKISKVVSTFLDGHFLGHQVDGRIHPTINQLRSEREAGGGIGTVSGRLSVTQPGFQQIPVRDPEFGPILRGLVLSDYKLVGSTDYKSQEPRLAIHFAAMADRDLRRRGKPGIGGAEEAVAAFNENPLLDPHQRLADLLGIKKAQAKTIYLGRTYGMGGAKLARGLGLSTKWMVVGKQGRPWEEIRRDQVTEYRRAGHDVVECAGKEAQELIKKLNERAPYVKGLFDACEGTAKSRGYIRTLLHRRCRFPGGMWTHKALNRLCQGSAADQMKQSMLDLWNAGAVPMLSIHDELLFSVEDPSDMDPYVKIMENAVSLLVPTVCDVNTAATWGAMKK